MLIRPPPPPPGVFFTLPAAPSFWCPLTHTLQHPPPVDTNILPPKAIFYHFLVNILPICGSACWLSARMLGFRVLVVGHM